MLDHRSTIGSIGGRLPFSIPMLTVSLEHLPSFAIAGHSSSVTTNPSELVLLAELKSIEL